MPEAGLIKDLAVVLLLAFIGGIVSKKIRLPLLIGYLLSGVILGNLLNNYLVLGNNINNIAQLGVALLLFTVGLEFSLHKLKQLSGVIIVGSLVQVLLTIFFGILVFPLLGLDFYSSFVLGTVFSFSSTALVVKILGDNGETGTIHGQISTGWLFMQDLYTVPLMVILPAIGKVLLEQGSGVQPVIYILQNLLYSVVLFFVIIIIGKQVIPVFIEKIADAKSRELILIGAVIICLLFAYVFNLLGFSLAIGAFIAGILLASSSAHHGIFAEVRPLRDLFSSVFFVSLGVMFNPVIFLTNWPVILSIVVLIITLKTLVSFWTVYYSGFHGKTAFLVAMSLVSIGEFAFVFASTLLNARLIPENVYSLVLSVSFISLLVSMPLSIYGYKLYYSLKKVWPDGLLSKLSNRKISMVSFESQNSIEQLDKHVIVLGYGRVGKYICHALTYAKIPYLVIDYDHKIVKHLQDRGIPVIYGDPYEIDVLNFAKIKNAKVVIMAYADRHSQETVIGNILSLNPQVELLCRVHFEEDQLRLKSLGITAAVQPEFEAAVTLTKKLFRLFSFEDVDIARRINNLKFEHGF